MKNFASSRTARAITIAALAASAVLSAPRTAHAEPVSPDAKGIVGTALLGGELVVFAEAIFGVRSTAAYLIGAGAGAVAGGVGGYFIEQAVDDGRIPAYLLAGGLAALIPAVVVTLDATRYMPSEGAREDKPVQSLPPSDPGQPGSSAVVGAEPKPAPAPAPSAPATTPAPAPAPAPAPGGGGGGGTNPGPISLFNLRNGNLFIGVPVPEVRPVLGANERTKMGADSRGSEVRFPVVNIKF